MRKRVKGWKCFDADLTCRGFQFEIGKSYTVEGKIELCVNGFHFHENGSQIFTYYGSDSRVCEVVADEVLADGNKSVCRTITVVRELSISEIGSLVGNGYGYGYGDGYGDGNGDGNGDGYGYGDGNGDGNGDGYGYGDGNGYGYGYGDGYGDGYGYGNGNGYGYGDGNGDGYGNGYGVNSTSFSFFLGFIERKLAA